MSDSLPLDKWAVIALQEDWVGRWNQSAMFPSELVFFLAFCEQSRIKRMFESGRYEGYSTERLAAYAEREGADVYSVDLESRPDIAQRGRERLSKHPSVHLTKGDTFQVLGNIMQSHPEVPAALVVDGPKLFGAISVLFAAAAFPWIRVIAMHNLDPKEHPETASFFTRVAGRPRYYEDYATSPDGAFARLRSTELERLSPRSATAPGPFVPRRHETRRCGARQAPVDHGPPFRTASAARPVLAMASAASPRGRRVEHRRRQRRR